MASLGGDVPQVTTPEAAMGAGLTHIDASGAARMVDVSDKAVTARTAVARARVVMEPETLERVLSASGPKGDVLQVARIAGIQGAKQTGTLIPLCHPLPLSSVEVVLTPAGPTVLEVRCTARVTARTGVEMEALTGASVAALTVYDMVKAVDRSVTVTDIALLKKTGGRSGTWTRPQPEVAS